MAAPHLVVVKPFHLNHDGWRPSENPDRPAFEIECEKLGLNIENPGELISSPSLRFWVRYWYRRRYVPEWLIEAFVPEYDPEFDVYLDERS